MKYAAEKNLKLFPLEWKMTKLQLRYIGHEVRVSPADRIRRLPHSILFRGNVGDMPRLSGGLEQAYPATMKRALAVCGLTVVDDWVALMMDRDKWKTFVEEEAMVEFLKGWEAREELRKQQRRRYEDIRSERVRLQGLEDIYEGAAESEDYIEDDNNSEDDMNFEFGMHRTVTRVTSTVNFNAQAAEEFINAQGWLPDLVGEGEGGRREEDDDGDIGENIWETLQESVSQLGDNEQSRRGTVMAGGEVEERR
jgi:hypothetical protein